MPRYYCDYCDTYLTHDSPSVRKQHNAGYKHKANVRQYYQQYEAQLNQSFIDQKVKEHLGVYRPVAPVGAPYNPMRPGVAILPTPQMPYPGSMTLPPGAPLIAGVRPPMMMHRPPPGAPAYISGPPMSMMVAPPSAPQVGQSTDTQRPTAAPPMGMPPSSGAPSLFPPVYQGAVPTSTSIETSDSNAQASNAAH